MAVVDAQDREVRRVHHGDHRERAEIHQQLAVAGDNEHALVRTRKREAEPHHGGRPHGTAERVDMRRIARHGADVAGGAARARDEQEILVPPYQRRHRFAALEHETGRRRIRQVGDFARCHIDLKTAWRRSAAG